MIIAAVEIE